jgi:hypothetical protein
VLYTTESPEVLVTENDKNNPARKLGKKSHHTTTLRPNVFPFAYIRTFYNEMDVGMTTEVLKAFAYEQSLKKIDIFYGRAANYCKRLQKALQDCQNNLVASKLYDAFERDHQVLANNLNREWILAVSDKMRELGIAVPEDTEDDLDKNDEPTNLELAADLLKKSTFTETDTTTTVCQTNVMFVNPRSQNEGHRKHQSSFIIKDRETRVASFNRYI